MKSSDMILAAGVFLLMAGVKKQATAETPSMTDPVFKALPVTMVVNYTIADAVRVGYYICGGGPVSYTHLTLPTILRV